MLIAGVLCCVAAVAVAARGLWVLTHADAGDPVQQVLRAVAPTQLAAAGMLAAGGVAAFVAPRSAALVVLIVGVVGAAGTVTAGLWHTARFAARQPQPAAGGGCGGSCTACIQPCH
ncbi:hypothetical protein [Mycobacterium sp. 1274756.6]|uniref:hypothetical protein n=1 Tax=Mycobacterium sp. 1274756.6 TaxID=1834076 RepID=UPI000800651B|nr:hypothetical protein [Mycobacterium sp. 1274756.6]OBJ73315.1 hypothetical protein A5643_04240 [Mycobacterium sp. 1274756.6]